MRSKGLLGPIGEVPSAAQAFAPSAASEDQIVMASEDSSITSDRVYVTNVTDQIDDESLREYFSHFGTVRDVYIPVDRATGQTRPFAFVKMSSPEEVAAILVYPSHDIGEGQTVNVAAAAPRPGGVPPGGVGKGAHEASPHSVLETLQKHIAFTAARDEGYYRIAQARAPNVPESHKQGVSGIHRLFVAGIPDGLNADMMRGHFARHGEILDIYIPPNKADIAFITFSSDAELQDALVGSGLRIAGYWVKSIKEAECRESRYAKGKGKADRYSPF